MTIFRTLYMTKLLALLLVQLVEVGIKRLLRARGQGIFIRHVLGLSTSLERQKLVYLYALPTTSSSIFLVKKFPFMLKAFRSSLSSQSCHFFMWLLD
jgi:hypothetical protein